MNEIYNGKLQTEYRENRPDEKVLVRIEDVYVARGEHTALQHAGRLRQFQVAHAELHAV